MPVRKAAPPAPRDRNAPVEVSGGHTFSTIGVGKENGCGITTSGTTVCWGANENGQLGAGIFGDQTSPVRVGGS